MPATSPRRRLFTEERVLLALAHRRNQALGVATAIAIVGLFAFAFAVWRSEGPASLDPNPSVTDPRASGVNRAVDRPPGESQPLGTAPDEREEGTETARPDSGSAFITVRTNVPARVFIDGTLIRRRTPLFKYPVKPGTRTFVLEAQGTRERFEFSLRFERGQHRTIDQQFESIPRR